VCDAAGAGAVVAAAWGTGVAAGALPLAGAVVAAGACVAAGADVAAGAAVAAGAEVACGAGADVGAASLVVSSGSAALPQATIRAKDRARMSGIITLTLLIILNLTAGPPK